MNIEVFKILVSQNLANKIEAKIKTEMLSTAKIFGFLY